MTQKKSNLYKKAGVDIDRADAFIHAIKPYVKKTQRPEVLSRLGQYAGLFAPNLIKYPNPVLVSTTDGVGTKLKIALELKRFEGLGQDLVAMNVNDLLCVGAEPLFFLDYFSCGKLNVEQAKIIIKGLCQCLESIQCSLLGGETAEMPGVYAGEEFDLAGFAVGMVNRDEMIDGSSVSIGNKIIAISSAGVHSNGFSLVRKIIEMASLSLNDVYSSNSQTLGEALIQPTKVYVKPVLNIKKDFKILSCAHITGGGLVENLPRVFPQSCKAKINLSSYVLPPLFSFLQEKGGVSRDEMLRVFNCGIGLVLIVSAQEADEICARLKAFGEHAWVVGEMEERLENEASVDFEGDWLKS